jgi:hypothetical protein
MSKMLKLKIYKTVILPIVLCGCETCPSTSSEHKLQQTPYSRVLEKLVIVYLVKKFYAFYGT